MYLHDKWHGCSGQFRYPAISRTSLVAQIAAHATVRVRVLLQYLVLLLAFTRYGYSYQLMTFARYEYRPLLAYCSIIRFIMTVVQYQAKPNLGDFRRHNEFGHDIRGRTYWSVAMLSVPSIPI